MSYIVDNAIIMAAGYASRFAPLSYECPKALLNIKGEVLIERQIRQLREAGIKEIIVVVGYKKEMFSYLQDTFGVILVENAEYNIKNNHSTIYAVKDYLKNSYICSADNYFPKSPFESEVDETYYSAVYSSGYTKEWCMEYDEEDWITNVTIGGENSWYMLGHAFWSEEFSKKYVSFLEEAYKFPETKDKFWEEIYMEHIDCLKMKIRRYSEYDIFEFDSLEELRFFDEKYKQKTGSRIMEYIAEKLMVSESEIIDIIPSKNEIGQVTGFLFSVNNQKYQYNYESQLLVIKGI